MKLRAKRGEERGRNGRHDAGRQVINLGVGAMSGSVTTTQSSEQEAVALVCGGREAQRPREGNMGRKGWSFGEGRELILENKKNELSRKAETRPLAKLTHYVKI